MPCWPLRRGNPAASAPTPDHEAQQLTQLLTRRRQVVEMFVSEKNRASSLRGLAREDVEATMPFFWHG